MGIENLSVGVVYPWLRLPAMDRGVTRRLVPQWEFLARHVRRIAVFSPGSGGPIHQNGVSYEFHQGGCGEKMLSAAAFRLYDGLGHHLGRGTTSARERQQWWHYLLPRIQFSLRAASERFLSSVDVVMIEYPFWSGLVGPMARRRGVPRVVSFYDILSDVVRDPGLKARVVANEQAACRNADALVCVSHADCAKLREWGFHAEMIPHAFDLTNVPVIDQVWRPGFRVLEEAKSRGAMVSLFVGSSLEPNRDAAGAVRAMASRVEDDIVFAIAGGCSGEDDSDPRCVSFGVVSENELNRLYELSDVVLAPVVSGSGASTKVLEALAKRKVLISTSFGVRSHGMVSGRDCVIEDDLDAYPRVLGDLKKSPSTREALRAGGWDFVQAFSLERVGEDYLRLLGRVADGR